MKKGLFVVISILFFSFPILTFGKVIVCNNDSYSASIDIPLDKIGIQKETKITINSDIEYNAIYSSTKEDIIEVTSDGLVKGKAEGSATIYVNIEFMNDPTSITTCRVDIPIEVVSSDASLKSLVVEGYEDDIDFSSDKYNYEITVPYATEKINILAEASSDSSEISGIGKKYLNEDTSEFQITVSSSDGSTASYKLIVLKEEANNDAYLKSLIVEGYVLNPKFDKDIYKYNLELDKSVNDIVISAVANNEKSKIDGIGSFTLASGENLYKVSVTSESGEENIYEINVKKNNGPSRLNSLSVEGYKLDKSFKSETFTYKLTIDNKVDSLKINAEADNNSKIEILGNENLKIGKNDIIIKVSNEDKISTTYKIIVYKLSEEEIKTSTKNESLLRILLILFIGAIIFTIVFIGIYIKKNFHKKKKIKLDESK